MSRNSALLTPQLITAIDGIEPADWSAPERNVMRSCEGFFLFLSLSLSVPFLLSQSLPMIFFLLLKSRKGPVFPPLLQSLHSSTTFSLFFLGILIINWCDVWQPGGQGGVGRGPGDTKWTDYTTLSHSLFHTHEPHTPTASVSLSHTHTRTSTSAGPD